MGLVPNINESSFLLHMSQITEDELSDVNDPEYNRLLDTGAKSSRSFKDSIVEAAKRLELYE